MVDLANAIYRDFETDGVPASGLHKPRKPKIREWGTWVESAVNTAFTSGSSVTFFNKADLDANLAFPSKTLAWVTNDPVAANNGIYQKNGASGTGSWSRVLDLPYSFIRLFDAGAGTANAIVATSSISLPSSPSAALLVMNVFEANTGAVTIAVNGAAAKPLVTNSGGALAADYLQAGMFIAFLDTGTSFRLLTDVVSSAIVAAADAAAAEAGAARDAALAAVPNVFVATRTALKSVDTALITAAYLKEAWRSGQFFWDGSDLSAVLTPSLGTTTSVDAAANTATKASHGLDTGDWFFSTSTVNGLTANTIYYAIKVDANTFKVATTRANAAAEPPVAVDLTGTTNFTFKRHMDPVEGVYVIPTGKSFDGSQGAWVRSGWKDGLSIVNFGAQSVTGIDNAVALADAVTCAALNNVELRVPAGIFEYSGTLDLGYPELTLRGSGLNESILKCTSSGRAVDILGTRPNHNSFTNMFTLKDVCIMGNVNTTDIVRIRINHALLRNVSLREAHFGLGCALRIQGCVAAQFNHVTCSSNAKPMASRPFQGIVLEADPTDARRASCNTFIDNIIEGMWGDGIDLVAADQNTFIGGTSENNVGSGVGISAGCQINTFIGMGFENFGYGDVMDEGYHTTLINCYGKKKLYVGNSSLFHHTDGGYWDNVEFGAGASFPTVENIKLRFFTGLAATGLTFNSNQTVSTRNIYDNPTTSLIFPKPATISPTVGASPYTYTNGTGRAVLATWSGGTVSQVVLQRGGPIALLPVAGSCMLQPGDGIQWTFTVAPTVVVLPWGTGYQ